MGRPQLIDRAKVLKASLELADEKGLQAVSIHEVARRLGVAPMTLYGHVENKSALLDGLVEELLSEFPLPDPGLPWNERLALIGQAARQSARRHPEVFPLLLSRSAATPGAHRVRQAVFSALLDAGLSVAQVGRAERLLTTLIVGFATSEASGRFRQSIEEIDEDYAYLEELVTRAITLELQLPPKAGGAR